MQQVAGISQLSADEPLEEYVKNRNWFCDMFNPYYDLCHEGTKIPKWCDNNATEIFCPNDPGFEYDAVTGGGGSTGGGGAGRTWDKDVCLDSNKNIIPCAQKKSNHTGYLYVQGVLVKIAPLSDYVICVDKNGEKFHCDSIGWSKEMGYRSNFRFDDTGLCYSVVPDGSFNNSVPCLVNTEIKLQQPNNPNGYNFDSQARMISSISGLPITDENMTDGIPNYVEPPPPPPSDPLEVEIPVGNEECGAICVWLSYIYNVMTVVNKSVLKVDSSIQEMVSKMTPQDLPINSVLLEKLNEILVAIDKVSFEMVKEAETNFWDVLGGAFGDIFDLIEFLIEKIIYLVIPEDTTNITTSFSNLSDTLNQKIKPVTDMKNTITSAVTVEDKQFENIQINLPQYGVVPFLKVDYLLMAIPYVRKMIGGSMILMTAIWAYRKVSSEMVK